MDSFERLREEFGYVPWILACENSWNQAYAPEELQDRVLVIIEVEKKEARDVCSAMDHADKIKAATAALTELQARNNWTDKQLTNWMEQHV